MRLPELLGLVYLGWSMSQLLLGSAMGFFVKLNSLIVPGMCAFWTSDTARLVLV